jgi:hypothetical protein
MRSSQEIAVIASLPKAGTDGQTQADHCQQPRSGNRFEPKGSGDVYYRINKVQPLFDVLSFFGSFCGWTRPGCFGLVHELKYAPSRPVARSRLVIECYRKLRKWRASDLYLEGLFVKGAQPSDYHKMTWRLHPA